jgi:hypothetical protein
MDNDNAGVHYRSIGRDKENFFVGQEKNGVNPFCDTLCTLGQMVDFLAHRWYSDNF